MSTSSKPTLELKETMNMADEYSATDGTSEDPTPVAVEVEPLPAGLANEEAPAPIGPTPVVELPVGAPAKTSPVVLADARRRSLRTLAQGYVMTGLAGLVVVLYPYATSGSLSHVDWRAVGLLALHPVGSALFAFAQRVLGKDPSA